MGQKILVVEDNELNLKLFCDLLRAHGYAAEPVRDGREAVDRARAFAPELVVMDIQMPHVSGLELIEQMKADEGLKRTPIMAVTAYAAKGDEERIRDAGAEGYVSKPISVVRFVEAVAGLLKAAAERPVEVEEAPADGRDGAAPERVAVPAASADAGEQAAVDAVAAAQGSSAIEAEVAAEAPAAEARAVEAASGGEAVAAEAVEAAEASAAAEAAIEAGERGGAEADADTEMRHAGEGRHPDSGAVEGEQVDPGFRRDDAGPNGVTP